jgi:ABC-2 type transport system permease protein
MTEPANRPLNGPLNGVVAGLTARQLLSGRRVLLVALLPTVLLALSVVVRATAGVDRSIAVDVLDGVALGVVVPLLGLIAGIGAIGGEIDDGSIVYLLTKPLSRHAIATTKTAVAAAVAVTAAAVPTWAAALVLGLDTAVAGAFALAAALAAAGYAAVVVALAVVTRAAVPIGLLYVLVWEGVVGGFVPGARVLSIRQWALGVAEGALGDRAFDAGLDAAVAPVTGAVLLAVTVVGATWLGGRRLGRVRVTGEG